MLSFLFFLAVFWAIVHYLHRKFNTVSALPTHADLHSSRSAISLLGRLHLNSSHTTFSLSHLVHISVNTSAFNPAYNQLLDALSLSRRDSLTSRPRSKSARLRVALAAFYNAAVIFACFGMLASFCGLLYALYSSFSVESSSPRQNVAPRSLTADQPNSSSFVRPILPGLTVPLSDTWVIGISILVSQLVHELGHALAAALASIPLEGAGISLWLLFPSAFVVFPPGVIDTLPAWSRGRIIAGGPFHNIVTYILLWITRFLAIQMFSRTPLATRHAVKSGLALAYVRPDSPLHGFMEAGWIITHLDDTVLGRDEKALQVWEDFLNGSSEQESSTLGWCVDARFLEENGETCCYSKQGLTCFETLGRPSVTREKGCLDPFPILTDSSNRRCSTSNLPSCICVQPAAQEQLLRLSVVTSENLTKVVLWQGPRNEIFTDVVVDTAVPRFGRHNLPPLLILLFDFFVLFWRYMEIANMSLAFFNLLPLPYLDGEQYLHAMVDYFLDGSILVGQNHDLEAQDFELDQNPYLDLGKRNPSRRHYVVLGLTVFKRGVLAGAVCLVALSLYQASASSFIDSMPD